MQIASKPDSASKPRPSLLQGSSHPKRKIANLNPLRARLAWSVLFGVINLDVNAAELPSSFTLRFAPPDGIQVSMTYRLSRERVVGSQTVQRDEAVSTTHGVFVKKGENYHYRSKAVANSLSRNGQAVNDPVMDLLAKSDLEHIIASDGRAREVLGFSGIEARMRAGLPPGVVAAIGPLISEQSLVAREKSEWNARYADFADGTFVIGDDIDTTAPYQLPTGGTIEYFIRTTFPRWEKCPVGDCVRIEQRFESDATELAKFSGKAVAALVQQVSASVPTPTFQTARITGWLSRLIDPKTMLIFSERISREITMPVTLPGAGQVPSVQREERTYEYTYR